MKVPRDLSGAQLVKALSRDWDYRKVHQEGSHIILQTGTPGPRTAVGSQSQCSARWHTQWYSAGGGDAQGCGSSSRA